MVKKTLGRRKVEIVKMTKESNLQVTFSKRKAGLFKKASEFCTLCDAKIAMIVFSPAGKVFSFGHPNVDVLLDHFRGCVVGHNNTNLDESYTKLHVQMLNKSYTEVNVNCWQYLIFVSLLFFDFDIEYYINVSQFMDILNKFIIRGFIRR